MPLPRRQFIAGSAAAGAALGLAFPQASSAQETGAAAQPLAAVQPEVPSARGIGFHQALTAPPETTRPMTRWWWFGGAVSEEELAREFRLMQAGGLRGVELQPVYPVAVDDPRRDIRNLRNYSPEWVARLRYALASAHGRGLQFDLTLGSGWPYGGPFMPAGLGAHKLQWLSRDFEGPGGVQWDLFPALVDAGHVEAVVAAPLDTGGQPEMHAARLQWRAPRGRWRVYVFISAPTRQTVKRPTLGMEGLVMDHFNRRAMRWFLEAAGDQVLRGLAGAARVPTPPFTSVFCDSLEVFGADWTPEFLPEFRRRRGYDLRPFLPALVEAQAGEETAAIRYDYHLTLSDLILENFFAQLPGWSRPRGMTARMQAHGAMGDVMRGYGYADIPEGESGEYADRYRVDIGHRRLASSAGHIYNKPVISCESYTWLRMPRFLVSLEMMKAASDAQFLDGINQVVNQGYSYSPPQAGRPGWVWYASTMVNHNNIWWRHYHFLAEYLHRVSAVLQQGRAVNPICVYVPLSDIYAHYGAGSLLMDQEIQKRLGNRNLLALRQAGYDFDFVNDDALLRARAAAGELQIGTARYQAAIVPEVEFMPPESLARLVEFARAGGSLIFTGRLPGAAPGRKDQAARTARLRRMLHELWNTATPRLNQARPAGDGQVAWVRTWAEARRQLRRRLAPDFEVLAATPAMRARAAEHVGFAHRREENGDDLYFLANVSPHAQKFQARFAAGQRRPVRRNPLRPAETPAVEASFTRDAATGTQQTECAITLAAYESCFLIFGKSSAAEPIKRPRAASALHLPAPVSISGPWRVTLGKKSATLRQLGNWARLAMGRGFSGWGIYETEFEWNSDATAASAWDWHLDLGAVHETAEAELNGQDLGAAWCGPRILACAHALQPGRNRLSIRVGNLWIEHQRLAPRPDWKPVAEQFGIRWGRYGKGAPKNLPPSGLLGPVRLLPMIQSAGEKI